MPTTIDTHLVRDGAFPWSAQALVEDFGSFGRIVAESHEYKSGTESDPLGWWQVEQGSVLGERVRLITEVSGDNTNVSITGMGENRVRCRFHPGPDFTDDMEVRLHVTHRLSVTLACSISGDIEQANVVVGARGLLQATIFDREFNAEVALQASGGSVQINRRWKATSQVSGSAQLTSTLQGNATVDPSGPSGTASLSATRELGGTASHQQEDEETVSATREGPAATIDLETATYEHSADVVFTRTRTLSPWLGVDTKGLAVCNSGSSEGVASVTVDSSPRWQTTAELWRGDTRVAVHPPIELDGAAFALLEQRSAVLALVSEGVPVTLAARAVGITSKAVLAKVLASNPPKDFRPVGKLLRAVRTLEG